jgi:membrane protein YqaA with SNARE-associated domain
MSDSPSVSRPNAFERKLEQLFDRLQQYADRWWYAPLIGFLAFADLFIIVVPTDGLLVTASMMQPKRWIRNFLCVTVGSSLGAILLAILVREQGLPFLLSLAPNLPEHWMWGWSETFLSNYGAWAVGLISFSPLIQHPAVALAALSTMPIPHIAIAVCIGRFFKYLIFSWIASHSPHLLRKLWGIRGELEKVHAEEKLDKNNPK